MVHIALIVATMLLGEVYQLFHTSQIRLRDWFLLIDMQQDIEWYIKDTAEAVCWIVFIGVFVWREKKGLFRHVLIAFLMYRIADLIFYWLNFSATTWQYAVMYLLMGTYTTYHSLKFYQQSKCKRK